MMMAVEDIATAPPTTTAEVGATPSSHAAASATIAVVTSTCAPPTPSTSPRMASKRGSENSSPSVNTRNATPKSASRRVVSLSTDQRERVRAEQHADREVAEDRRQGELAHAGHDEYRGGQQDQNLQQRIGVHSRSI